MTSQAAAGAAVGIVEEGGAIQADADGDFVAAEALTPLRVNKNAIGLDRLVDAQAWGIARHRRTDAIGGGVVKIWGNGQGFARMPKQREIPADERTGKHLFQNRIEELEVEAAAVIPVRQVAVIAVEIAIGGWLNDQQGQGSERVGFGPGSLWKVELAAHQLRKPPPPLRQALPPPPFLQAAPPLRQPPPPLRKPGRP